MNIKILAIDGGGTRGVIPATILDCVYKDTGLHPRELFDLMAGTSTGGILSIAYAYGIPTQDLIDLYITKSQEIFYESWFDRIQGMDEHLRANYSNTKFKKILQGLLGKATLGDLQNDKNFGKQGKNLMVTSFDLHPNEPNDENKNYRPLVFHSGFIRDKNISLVDLALMTSAGPTYFPVYDKRYIDGGVAFNNPSMAAIAYALNKGRDTKDKNHRYPSGVMKGLGLGTADIRLLSLSTGTSNMSKIPPSVVKNGNWGSIQWIKYLPDLLTESNMQSTQYYVKQMLNDFDSQYHRVNAYFDQAADFPILRNQKHGIKMDTKEPQILEALHEYTLAIYRKERTQILKTIEQYN